MRTPEGVRIEEEKYYFYLTRASRKGETRVSKERTLSSDLPFLLESKLTRVLISLSERETMAGMIRMQPLFFFVRERGNRTRFERKKFRCVSVRIRGEMMVALVGSQLE